MKKWRQRWWWQILWILPAFLLFHCSTPQMAMYDDALDIKPERQFAYEVAPCIDTTNPDGNRRDGRTLRGQVLELVILAQDTAHQDTFFVFLNKGVSDPDQCVERIPLRDVLLPALDSPMVRNRWNNINKIRSYNNVQSLRFSPIQIIPRDCQRNIGNNSLVKLLLVGGLAPIRSTLFSKKKHRRATRKPLLQNFRLTRPRISAIAGALA